MIDLYFQTTVGLAVCKQELSQYGKRQIFFICFSKTSQGQGLRDSIGKEDHVTFLNRAECCHKFNIEDGDDNIKVMQHIIAEVPPSSVVLFDEVPLTSRFDKQKASYDWSLLENKRPGEVSVVVCLQPILIDVTFRPISHDVIGPEDADVVKLTNQYRNTITITKFVNQWCQKEDGPKDQNKSNRYLPLQLL